VHVIDVEDSKERVYVVDRETEVALLPREDRREVLTKHYPKYSRVFAQVYACMYGCVCVCGGGGVLGECVLVLVLV
jgi:hypothetical protein